MFPHLKNRRAFTLLEICVVMFIAMMLMGLALPSLTGQSARQRLTKSFERIDALVIEAQRRSVTEGKPFVLVWSEQSVVRLYPAEWTAKQRRKEKPSGIMQPASGDERYALERNASLATSAPLQEWTFWPTGNCEPAIVHFKGAIGEWDAAYNPLSARGSLDRFIVN